MRLAELEVDADEERDNFGYQIGNRELSVESIADHTGPRQLHNADSASALAGLLSNYWNEGYAFPYWEDSYSCGLYEQLFGELPTNQSGWVGIHIASWDPQLQPSKNRAKNKFKRARLALEAELALL